MLHIGSADKKDLNSVSAMKLNHAPRTTANKEVIYGSIRINTKHTGRNKRWSFATTIEIGDSGGFTYLGLFL